ncbi:MAG: hypothetical protein ACK50J_23980, partial [Planctomyces sp.]
MSGRTESILQLLNNRTRAGQSAGSVEEEATEYGENPSAEEYTPFALGRVSRRPQMMLLLRQCTGEVTVYPYSLLMQIHSQDPSKGFTLTFGDHKVQIEGENLTHLFNYVCQHRATEIVEAGRAELLTAAVEAVVTRLS